MLFEVQTFALERPTRGSKCLNLYTFEAPPGPQPRGAVPGVFLLANGPTPELADEIELLRRSNSFMLLA